MIKLHNTLSGLVEEFRPINDTKVNFYCCGPTVYNDIHVGNARPLVVFDTVRRFLIFMGYDVKYVFNFTDVDDKIINKANESGITSNEVAEKYIERFKDVAGRLGIYDYDNINPRATEHMDEIIDFVKALVDKGTAYESDGDVYFDTTKAKDYGKLSKKNIDDLISGLRVDINEKKKNPLDFALWKKAKPNEPHWASPWSEGRPGWHIECSAMSCHYLGETFDIHGGGPDLIFPHHENEIAQSEGANGKRFANYWMHTGPLRVMNKEGKEEKMSKSLGNFWTVRDAVAETDDKFGVGNGAQVLRFFLMRTHYRSPILFGPDLIVDAYQSLKRLYTALKDVPADDLPLDWNEECAMRFAEAMNDDFNVPVAVAQLFELANRAQAQKSAAMSRQLKKLGAILNILQGDPEVFLKGSTAGLDEAAIEEAIAARAAAKKAKDYAKADEIRKHLAEQGVMLTDTPQGTTWQRVLVEKSH